MTCLLFLLVLRFIVVADYRKNAQCLGTNVRTTIKLLLRVFLDAEVSLQAPGVPIEVVPFAYAKVLHILRDTLGSPLAALRIAKAKAGPVVSDNGNFIIDAPFPQEIMREPHKVRTGDVWHLALTLMLPSCWERSR